MIFILMQIDLISTRKVVHLASFWKAGFLNSEVAYWFWSNEVLFLVKKKLPLGICTHPNDLSKIKGKEFVVETKSCHFKVCAFWCRLSLLCGFWWSKFASRKCDANKWKKFAWSWEFPDPVLASYMNHATDTRIISSRVGLSLPGLLA